MTAEDAWKEMLGQLGSLKREGGRLLYFWETDDNARQRKGVVPLAYAVVSMPEATGQVVVFAKWEPRNWEPNPWNERHLIRHLIDELQGARNV